MKRARLYTITLCALAALGLSAAQAQPGSEMTQTEQASVDVVKGFMAAWQAGDVDKMSQYVADNIKFSLDPSDPYVTGRDIFECRMRQMSAVMKGGGKNSGYRMKVLSYQAKGDKVFTLIIQRRIDTAAALNLYGPGSILGNNPPPAQSAQPVSGDTQVGAFFLVKNGKILQWLDVAIGLDMAAMGNPGPKWNCQ